MDRKKKHRKHKKNHADKKDHIDRKDHVDNLNYDKQKINKDKIHIRLNDLFIFMRTKSFHIDTFGILRKKLYQKAVFDITGERYTKYISPESNKQIRTIWNQPNVAFRNRFIEMMTHFIGDMYTDIIGTMLKYQCDDDEIYSMIKHGASLTHSKRKYSPVSKEWRISRIVDKIEDYTQQMHNDKSYVPNILDVGAGNGKNARLIKKMTQCNIYGADISAWGPYSNVKKFDFPFAIIETNPYRIPYDDIKFDFIILILTLHHCEDIFDTINECKRLLTEKGLIIIVEHDVWNDYDNMIIDIQHNIYSKIYDEPPVTNGSYFNYFEWDYLFNKCGMEPIYGDLIEDSPSFHVRYDLQFMGIYKKV